MGKPVFQALRGHRPSPRMRASLEEARSEGGTWLFSTQALSFQRPCRTLEAKAQKHRLVVKLLVGFPTGRPVTIVDLCSGKGFGSLVLSSVQTCGLSRHHWHTKPKEGTRQYCRLRLDVPASSWSKAGFHQELSQLSSNSRFKISACCAAQTSVGDVEADKTRAARFTEDQLDHLAMLAVSESSTNRNMGPAS